ncbi:MAG: elongation factor P, partial [Candidatus Komeilibacteria bacterium]|nr:elongation factor P [Candidatus Komeilibacteria bacterium]
KETIGDPADFLKEGVTVDVLIFEGRPVSVKLPTKVELLITETPPGVMGDTAGSAMKTATLETGKEIRVPLFINQGELIRVNTETEEYVERVS